MKSFLSPLIERFRKARIPPFLPRFVGGAGFPTVDEDAEYRRYPRFARAIRWCISRVVQGNLRDGLRLVALSHHWQMSKRKLESYQWTQDMLDTIEAEFGYTSLEADPQSVSRSDAFKSIFSFLSGSEEMAFGVVPTNEKFLPFGELGRRLNHSVDQINLLIPRDRLNDPVNDLASGVRRWKDFYEKSFRFSHVSGAAQFASVLSLETIRPTEVHLSPPLKRRRVNG